MIWQNHQTNVQSSACSLYKAIFPKIAPRIKNKTIRASSLVLSPSSLTVVMAEAGLFVWEVFLIRSPSSSYRKEP